MCLGGNPIPSASNPTPHLPPPAAPAAQFLAFFPLAVHIPSRKSSAGSARTPHSFEVTRQPERSLRSNPPPLVHNFSDPRGRYMKLQRQLVHRQLQRLHKIFPQNFSRMHRRHQLCRFAHFQLSSFVSSVTLWQSHSFKSSQPAVSEMLPGTSARLVSAICIRSPAHARQSENLQECVSARSFLVSCYAPRTLDTHSPPRGKPAPSTPTQS